MTNKTKGDLTKEGEYINNSIEYLAKMYSMTGDYHTHTVHSKMGFYLHGKGSVLDNVRAAHEAGLKEIAITDHGPKEVYGLKLAEIPLIREEIRKASEIYPDVKVYFGVEANIMNSNNGLDITPEEIKEFDFINAGYHYGVPRCDMILNWIAFKLPSPKFLKRYVSKRNTKNAVRAINCNNIRTLTHPGDKAHFDMEALAQACEDNNTLIEINARHKRPNIEDITTFSKYDVKFIINSDAHKPIYVGRYLKSLKLAVDAGLSVDRIVNIESRSK